MLANDVTKMVGCIPSYWDVLYANTSMSKDFSTCKSQGYRYIEKLLGTKTKFRRLYKNFSISYEQPCTEIKMVVSKIEESWRTSDYNKLRIYISYVDEKYIDIQDIKGYNPEALLGQVGGFIGMVVIYPHQYL